MTRRAPITIGIVFALILHILSISISKFLYFDSFCYFVRNVSDCWYRYINK